jgi:hypothetical protein
MCLLAGSTQGPSAARLRLAGSLLAPGSTLKQVRGPGTGTASGTLLSACHCQRAALARHQQTPPRPGPGQVWHSPALASLSGPPRRPGPRSPS